MIIYRIAKGAPLTGEDLDQNFKELELRLQALESIKGTSETPQLILEGDLLIQLQEGQKRTLGRVPVVRFNPKGIWKASEDYFPMDLVLVEDQIYSCSQSHTASIDFKNDQRSWEIFFKLPKSQETGGL